MLPILSFSSFQLKLHICTKTISKKPKTKNRANSLSLVIAYVMNPAEKTIDVWPGTKILNFRMDS